MGNCAGSISGKKRLELARFFHSRAVTVVAGIPGSRASVGSWTAWRDSGRRPGGWHFNKWFAGDRQKNVCVVTGTGADDLVVLDWDDRDAYRAWLRDAPAELRRTFRVKTRQGWHAYFFVRYVDGRAEKCAGAEVKRDNLVCVFGIGASGRTYRPVGQGDIVTVDNLAKIGAVSFSAFQGGEFSGRGYTGGASRFSTTEKGSAGLEYLGLAGAPFRNGGKYKWFCCPQHADGDRPADWSLSFNPATGGLACYGAGCVLNARSAGRNYFDAIDVVRRIEGIDFGQAADLLRDRYDLDRSNDFWARRGPDFKKWED